MSVAKISEISASSTVGFDDAIRLGIDRANKTLRNVKGAWISEMKVDVEGGEIVAYRVNLRVTFVLKD
jgi:flavin-binding protein dodecin